LTTLSSSSSFLLHFLESFCKKKFKHRLGSKKKLFSLLRVSGNREIFEKRFLFWFLHVQTCWLFLDYAWMLLRLLWPCFEFLWSCSKKFMWMIYLNIFKIYFLLRVFSIWFILIKKYFFYLNPIVWQHTKKDFGDFLLLKHINNDLKAMMMIQ
jgi:hypothetical protein